MCPFAARLVTGSGGIFATARIVCHCLLVETRAGLLLVDTGFGLDDVARPARFSGAYRTVVRPKLLREETAAAQVEALGFSRGDVRDIAVTHLDMDHAGGLADFPEARVHLLRAEHEAAMAPRTSNERHRYLRAQWAHGPRWALHEPSGERWMGFESVRALDGEAEVLLVPLHGHTRGHAGVAVRTPSGWILHAGDAYFFHGEIDPVAPSCPPGLAAFQHLLAVDREARLANRARLAELARAHGAEVRIVSAHDPVELGRALREAERSAPAA